MNCWNCVLRIGFLIPFHIVASVSFVPFILSIASFADLRFSCVSCLGGLVFPFLIPWYAVVCLVVASLAPCRSNSGVTRGLRVSL